MLKELYEKGYINYNDIILDNYKALGISEKDALVLIKILKLYEKKKNIKTSEIVQLTTLSLEEVQESLNHLLDLEYYDIYMNLINGKGEEFYNMHPFFMKLERFFSTTEEASMDKTEIENVINLLEQKLCRNVTPMEMHAINSWIFDDKYSPESIGRAINNLALEGKLTFKNIERKLLNESKTYYPINSDDKLSAEDNKAIDEFLSNINRK